MKQRGEDKRESRVKVQTPSDLPERISSGDHGVSEED
jgi:hypothetical protein